MAGAKVFLDKLDQTNHFSFHQGQAQPTNFLQSLSMQETGLNQAQFSNIIPSKRAPEIDLNLRLSIGGVYSGGNTKGKPLSRSSSLAGTSEGLEKSLPKSFLSLARSQSLPAEVERSKRVVMNVKELRVMRRSEAKKRVVEKQRNIANYKASEKDKFLAMEGPPSSPSKVPAWAAASAAKNPALNRAINRIQEGLRKLEGLEGLGTPKVPSESLSTLKAIKAEPVFTSETASDEKSAVLKASEFKCEFQAKKAKLHNNGCIQNNRMKLIKKMPSVTTTGDGPNGRKIEGFLYTYLKGKVSIVCVCHGNFLSPEEFVKHAGRKDVTNPMRHINVSFSY